MTTVNPYEEAAYSGTQFGQMTTQPMATAFIGGQPVNAPVMTAAGSMVAPGQPDKMIAYRLGRQELLPITAENLCKMAEFPINVTCPHCNTMAVTEIETKIGSRAICYIIMMSMVCFCFMLLCMLDLVKDRIHHCGNCKEVIAMKDFRLTAEYHAKRR